MIWIFDSWLWWVHTLGYFRKLLPEYDYIYFADNINLPYWNKTHTQIKKFTYDWINYLFDKGAQIVILACNTASAYSVKQWQADFPSKKVLSVTIPWVEAIIEKDLNNICVFATTATVKSKIFIKKFEEIRYDWCHCKISQIACHWLVDIIENHLDDKLMVNDVLDKIFSDLNFETDWIILWCTHYPIISNYFQDRFNWVIIDPWYEASIKFVKYLKNHPEIESKLSKWWNINFYASWNVKKVEEYNSKMILI